jgi:lipopolysaccharide transport system permease protein
MTQPELVITGGPGRLRTTSLREVWLFREVLWAFSSRQVKVRYKQAAVGISWAVIQPVATAGLFAVFLGRIARLPSEGVSYLVFALAGMVVWSYFAAATTGATESLVADQALLRKVYFPREILPLALVGASLVDLAPALLTFLVVAVVSGHPPGVQWLALWLPVLLVIVSAASAGLLLSALNVYYRDARFVVPFALQLGLFASPVIYSVQQVPARWRTVYVISNPIACAIDGLRRTALHHRWPDLAVSLASLSWALALLVCTYAIFKRLERSFADRV